MSTVDEAPLFDASVKKKKKSKKPADFLLEADGDAADEAAGKLGGLSLKSASPEADDGAGADGDFEFKKKKKKSKKPAATADEFDQALADAGVAGADAGAADGASPAPAAAVAAQGQDGNPDSASFEILLSRFFDILRENNPEMAGDRTGIKYKIPPPIVTRDGNKKTLFSNIKAIADKMHRPTEHIIHFLFTELGTSGSVDGSQRLVIKGRFQPPAIEGVLRRYILEYVTCKTCRSINTRLTKENRLYFLDCNSCGSRRSVQSIKAGYQAVTRASRRKK